MSEMSAGATSLDATGAVDTIEGTDENGNVFLQAETGTLYRTKEDAAKGIAEKDRYIEKLKAELAAKSSQDELLGKITDSIQRGVQPQKPAVDPDALLKQYAERIDTEGGAAVVDLLSNYLQIKEEQEEQKIGSMLKQRDEEIKRLREQLMDFDPRYQARKEQIDEVQKELGVDRDTAVRFVDKFIKKPEQPDRPQIPGMTAGIRTGHIETQKLDADARQFINRALGRPLTAEEEKALLERETARKNRRS